MYMRIYIYIHIYIYIYRERDVERERERSLFHYPFNVLSLNGARNISILEGTDGVPGSGGRKQQPV